MVTLLHLPNQLCNRLFLIGNVIANSIEHGDYPVSNPCFLKYAHDFEVGQADALLRYPEGLNSALWDAKQRVQRERLISLGVRLGVIADNRRVGRTFIRDTEKHWDPTSQHYTLTKEDFRTKREEFENLCLIGFRARDKDALFRQRDPVVHFLRPRRDYLSNVEQYLSEYRARKTVGVHIRLGDYRQWLGGKYAFSFEQYRKWCDQVCDFSGRDTRFILASNEPVPLEVFTGLDVVLAPGHPMLDLYALAGCDLIMGAPSTFSSWAAFQRNTPMVQLLHTEMELSEGLFAPPAWETTP